MLLNTRVPLRRSVRTVAPRTIPVALFHVSFWACTAFAGNGSPPMPKHHETVIGLTMPYQQAVLAAVGPGRIARIAVPEGGRVLKGELVFAQDDRVQRVRTELAEAAAESTIEIELARARWDLAKRDLHRLTGLYGDDSASSKELSDARSEADMAGLEHELARFARGQAERAYRREAQRLREYQALAPFTGYVTERIKHVGETVDERDGVVRMVQLDPLKISVDCPLSLARRIHVGEQVWVRPVDPRWEPRMAKVLTAGRVVDAASQTFKVKLRVDNTESGWMAGLKVAVEFPLEVVSTGAAARPEAPTLAAGKRSGSSQRGKPNAD